VASLFPHAAAIGLEDRLVAGVPLAGSVMPDPAVDRLTLTLRALNGARAAVFVVTGPAKAAAVRAGRGEPRDRLLRPAQGIAPTGGPPEWILDRPAGADLR
jgi:6-phosphogluconolactonase